jgi:transcriptional regulator GlxA family with amidase domain
LNKSDKITRFDLFFYQFPPFNSSPMKQLGILIFDDVEVLDFAGPFEVFSVANQLSGYTLLEVHTFSLTTLPIRARNGLQVVSNHSITSIPTLDYLVLPGGDGTKKIIQNGPFIEQIKQQVLSSEWTMSVCSGSRILGKAGFLEHKPYCTHHEVFESMASLVPSGIPKPTHRFIQSDTGIWTAAGISAGIDLALHLTEITFGKELAFATAKYMEYTP